MNRTTDNDGMTLIELLVVIFLLAALAGSAVSLVGIFDDRERREITVARLAEIRASILGPNAIASNGELLSGGYLQDVGRLPQGDEDLLRRPDLICNRTYSEKWKVWYGWNGPYFSAPQRRKTDLLDRIYDGWGNDFYGWPESDAQPGEDFAVRSRGEEQDDAGDDLPHSGQPLIGGNEWTTNVNELRVKIINRSSQAVSGSFRLKIVAPEWEYGSGEAALEVPPEDSDRYYSREFALNLSAAPEGATDDDCDDETIQFGAGEDVLIPNGNRMLFLLEIDGGDFRRLAYYELRLSNKLTPAREIVLRIRD